KVVNGIAANDYTHTVREDPTRKGLLYAGTQHGFYVSYDDGYHWQPFRQGLPDTPVTDVWVDANDIAITAHGRGFWVLDDIASLRPYEAGVIPEPHLFNPADAIRGGENATIDYWLKTAPKSLTLEILDRKGQVVRSYPGAPPKPAPAKDVAASS